MTGSRARSQIAVMVVLVAQLHAVQTLVVPSI